VKAPYKQRHSTSGPASKLVASPHDALQSFPFMLYLFIFTVCTPPGRQHLPATYGTLKHV